MDLSAYQDICEGHAELRARSDDARESLRGEAPRDQPSEEYHPVLGEV